MLKKRIAKANSLRVIKDSTREKLKKAIYKNPIYNSRKDKGVSVLMIDANSGKILKEFPTKSAAAKEMGVKPQSIDNAVKKNFKCKGFKWKNK